MDKTADDQVAHELGLLFNYNPKRMSNHPRANSLALAPLSFYDRHLDNGLALKKVVISPSLRTHLSQPVDSEMKKISHQKLSLPRITHDTVFPTLKSCLEKRRHKGPATDARFVAEDYKHTTGYFGPRVASMFSLHPHHPIWSSVMLWAENRVTVQQDYYSLDEGYGPEVDEEALDSMDETLRRDLQEVRKRFPMLATWQILCANQEAEGALKAMDGLGTPEVFPSREPLTSGYPGTNIAVPHSADAVMTSWGMSVDSFATEVNSYVMDNNHSNPEELQHVLRRSSRILAKRSAQKEGKNGRKLNLPPRKGPHEQGLEWRDIVPPTSSSHSGDISCDSLATSLIQHAWARAVEDDSTFIILYNGNYERIGFRHRSSRTLFLSELIDITRCTDPAYGKLHIGLFIAIIEDALARTRQQLERERLDKKKPRKRPLSVSESSSSAKRPKTRAHVTREAAMKIEERNSFETVFKGAANRDLALIRIHDRVLNSPVPSSFLRIGHLSKEKKAYSPQEYMMITIRSMIATGATGAAHKATLELPISDHKASTIHNVVVKLAFDVNQRKRLRHEFSVYQHLISSKVKGIPTIFGLFQDVETRALALVMNHVGTCVLDREPGRDDSDDFDIPEPQRASFIEVMKDIHGAGVRHRDIRPENMVIDDDGSVAIIDFDRADLDASEGSRERELQHMLDLLNGEYYEPGDQPSLRSNPRSHTPLESSESE